MSLHRKRHGDIEYSRSTLGKRQHHRSPSLPRRGGGSAASDHRRPSFPSYQEVPDLPSKIWLLCKIIASSASLESSLDDSGVGISSEDVEEVLKLSYSHPASAVKFFRWAGHRLQHRHSPYSWNLVVDLLGKNLLFDAMWDAVHSMLAEGLVSLATFASIFSSFAAARRPADALAAFDTLPAHGVPQDVAALNSLLSALSRENLTASAYDFLHQNQHRIRPDADSYAILLEGFENERNRRGAREVFDEMVLSIGWDTSNIPAYDTFLNTLLFHSTGGLDEALRWLLIMKEHNCYPGKKFVRNAIEECIKLKDLRTATLLWDSLVGKNGCQPDTELYNSMISLFCHLNQMDSAFKFLDDMVPNGAFPDSRTYNLMLQYLIKSAKLQEVFVLLKEMVKNEFLPSPANCNSAMKMFIDFKDWDMAMKAWKIMADNGIVEEEVANSLVIGLRDHDRLPEACKYADIMINKGIKLHSSTMSKLKISLVQVGKGPMYDLLLSKWKMCSRG